MKPFMDENFLLKTKTAQRLYFEAAADCPIIDYHCHVPPQMIAENASLDNIGYAWLGGDHYKWRAMRANGIPEEMITGNASDHDKFLAYAKLMPKAIGNPLYHWTHLELQRFFGFTRELNEETAEECWNICNALLAKPEFRVHGILERFKVRFVGTTDDPADTLEYHKTLKENPLPYTQVAPTFRPDKAVNIDKDGFTSYIGTLSKASGVEIRSIKDRVVALFNRICFFDSLGCRASDHGLDYIPFNPCDEATADSILQRVMNGEAITVEMAEKYKTYMLIQLGAMLYEKDWVMQLHYNAQRNLNKPMFAKLGPDTGYDSIAAHSCALTLAGLLNALQENNTLPRTIVYSLNPNDNLMIDSVIGSFQNSDAVNKLQHGSAWWFNDTKMGMEAQLTTLASCGLLGNFVGMLTDSRSFLSYTRHEYFRRILCNIIGNWVEEGEIADNSKELKQLVRDVSFENARRYFRID